MKHLLKEERHKMAKIKAFIFDLDGVITDSAEYHYHAWKNLASELGINIDREFNEKLKGISRMDSLERILVHGNQQDRYSEKEKEQLAAKKNDEYVTLIEQISEKDILPGIATLIDELKSHGYQLAIASASKNAPAILSYLGIKEKFDAIVDPSTIAKGKPDPAIFLEAAKLLKVEPDACVGIEDAEAGIESINKAGMFSVGVGSEEAMKEAHYYVTSTTELSLEQILKEVEKANV